MTEHRCVTCPQLRLGEPRAYDQPHVCGGCRARLRALLAEVVELYALLPDMLEPSRSAGARVSGSRSAPLPLSVTVLDLTMPARPQVIHDPHHDQVGHPGVASVLELWAIDWLDTLTRPQHRPAATVVTLAAWFAVWLDDACAQHPAVDEWAAEIRGLVDTLRSATGNRPAKPAPCDGVPCRRCDLLTLVRTPDGSGDVECGNPDCRIVMRADEYATWTRLVSAPLRAAS